jgi:hypothetical protein
VLLQHGVRTTGAEEKGFFPRHGATGDLLHNHPVFQQIERQLESALSISCSYFEISMSKPDSVDQCAPRLVSVYETVVFTRAHRENKNIPERAERALAM